jgi:aminoglycoside 2'-N-acetyltransferase I
MMAVLERFVRSGYQLGALGASIEGSRLYVSRGWQLWRGRISAMTPDGIRPMPAATVYVLPVSVPVDVSAELTSDWRPASLW